MNDNPQKAFVEPVRRRAGRYVFVPGKGMVPDPANDIDPAMEYEVNEAIADSEAAARSKQSHANVGYANLKRGR